MSRRNETRKKAYVEQDRLVAAKRSKDAEASQDDQKNRTRHKDSHVQRVRRVYGNIIPIGSCADLWVGESGAGDTEQRQRRCKRGQYEHNATPSHTYNQTDAAGNEKNRP